MTNEEVFNAIVEDKNLKPYVREYGWFSGSTYVTPYTFWDNEYIPHITIQLNVYVKGGRNYAFYKKDERKLAKIADTIISTYPDNLTCYKLDAKDGSCPPTLTLYVKERE